MGKMVTSGEMVRTIVATSGQGFAHRDTIPVQRVFTPAVVERGGHTPCR